MTAKDITYPELRKAIEISFKEDDYILSLYDPNAKVICLHDIVENIIGKVSTHSGLKVKGVYEKGELIGYIVYNHVSLISFSLASKYRVRKFLRAFFDIIKREMGGRFVCYLFNRNVRAIKWLQKNGADIVDMNTLVTKLVYS